MNGFIVEAPHLFRYLLGYRALLGVLALYSVIDQPIRSAVPALIVLGGLLLIGEAVYKNILAYEERRLALQKEREVREQRAEEARQRMEAFKQAQQEASEAFAEFDDEPPGEPDGVESPPASSDKPAS